MRHGTTFLAAAFCVLALGAPPAPAQHDGKHGAPSGADGAHRGAGHHGAEACEREFEQVVADGRGFGMAFTADRHGYPGPLHVLELSRQLGLSAEQEARVRGLMEAMFAESRPRGAELLAAERRLGKLFASGAADEAAVRAAVADVERRRAELRTLHLTTHLRTREVLTAEQRRLYHAARWP